LFEEDHSQKYYIFWKFCFIIFFFKKIILICISYILKIIFINSYSENFILEIMFKFHSVNFRNLILECVLNKICRMSNSKVIIEKGKKILLQNCGGCTKKFWVQEEKTYFEPVWVFLIGFLFFFFTHDGHFLPAPVKI